MSLKKKYVVSIKKARKDFNTIGLILILYILFALVVPHLYKTFIAIIDADFVNDEYLYYGAYFLIMFIGTMIPALMLRIFGKVKNSSFFKIAQVSFIDLFVQTIIVFSITICLTYISNIILATFGFESKLISDIGFNYTDQNLNNLLYVFMSIGVAPLIEEFFFRGLLLNTLSKYGKAFALYATAFVFALAHGTIGELLPAFFMGVLLGKISLRYKSIQPSIFIHIFFNVIMYLLCIIPESIAKYMSYGLAAVIVLAAYLFLTGRYRKITIQRLPSTKLTNKLFYTSFSMILVYIDFIVYMAIYVILQ